MKRKPQNGFNWGFQASYLIFLIIIGASSLTITILIYERYDPGVLQLNVENLRSQQMGEVEAFLILADRFAANHEYTDEYQCRNYTNDLGQIADQLGFNIEKVVGCSPLNLSECHTWVRLKVDYEPQQGRFIDYSRKYVNQRVYE